MMHNRKKILITGGSGMIGSSLTSLLIQKGYEVSHLGRSRTQRRVRTFLWDPLRNEIEKDALRNIDVIIHLAGAGIADKRWNEERKKEILESRAHGARLIKSTASEGGHEVRAFISASGINYYGLKDTGTAFSETDAPGDDFMAGVSRAWEQGADAFGDLGARVVKIRTGVVLSRDSIALDRIATPVKFFVGAPLGSGQQYFNWIHIDDLCGIYLKAIEDPSMQGPYNAVAPNPVTNRELTEEIASILKRPLWLPAVPGFVVRLIAGEVAEIVLEGGKVSADKLKAAGFDFRFATVRRALEDIYSG